MNQDELEKFAKSIGGSTVEYMYKQNQSKFVMGLVTIVMLFLLVFTWMNKPVRVVSEDPVAMEVMEEEYDIQYNYDELKLIKTRKTRAFSYRYYKRCDDVGCVYITIAKRLR